jgi:hypothetical protein
MLRGQRQVAGRCAGDCDEETLKALPLPYEELNNSMLLTGTPAPGKPPL